MKNRNLWLNLAMAIISLTFGFILSPVFINLVQDLGLNDTTPLAAIFIILIVSCVLFFIIRSFILRKYDKPVWIIFSVIYFAIMFTALFLKGQSQGVNFDFRHLFDQYNSGSHERAFLIGNCLAFMPYPLLLHFWGIKTKPWRAFLLFVVIEGLQFALSVGTFDVIDLAAYIIGYLLGYLVLILYINIGVQSAYNIPVFISSKKRGRK